VDIDIAKEIGRAPSVSISVDSARGKLVVVDGPGLPPETVVPVLDYSPA
jgi:hypothetical protein